MSVSDSLKDIIEGVLKKLSATGKQDQNPQQSQLPWLQ